MITEREVKSILGNYEELIDWAWEVLLFYQSLEHEREVKRENLSTSWFFQSFSSTTFRFMYHWYDSVYDDRRYVDFPIELLWDENWKEEVEIKFKIEREEKEERVERGEEYRKAKEELDSKFPDVIKERNKSQWLHVY